VLSSITLARTIALPSPPVRAAAFAVSSPAARQDLPHAEPDPSPSRPHRCRAAVLHGLRFRLYWFDELVGSGREP
jgi:hypothetical protein